MSAVEHDFHSTDFHPIDIVETLAVESEWDFDRHGEDQIAMAIEGAWRTYSLNLAWSTHDDMLRLVCSFELTPPEDRMEEMLSLINLTNDKIWCGNFTLWPEHKMMAFRYGLTLAGGASATPEQIEAMVLTAVGYSERFYPAFQLVGWSNHSPEDALSVAIDEAYGTA
ncbi:MAG: YbjN domain-containing protein [Pseudomonadota bacterium]